MQNEGAMKKTAGDQLILLGRIGRAPAPEGMYERIMQRLHDAGNVISMVPPARVWLAAACITLLICFNVWLLSHKGGGEAVSAASAINQEYFGYTQSQSLYP